MIPLAGAHDSRFPPGTRASGDPKMKPRIGEAGWQMACKPDSVQGQGPLDGHSSGPAVTARFLRPTRNTRLEQPRRNVFRVSYSTLLPAGLAVPPALPRARWALTPPFHHCLRRQAVCSLWRFPSGLPGRALPGAVAPWSPDFPHRRARTPRRCGHPAICFPTPRFRPHPGQSILPGNPAQDL